VTKLSYTRVMSMARKVVFHVVLFLAISASNGQDDCPWNWNITAGSTCDDYDPISQCLFDASRNVRKDCAENSDKECRRSSSFSCRSDCKDFHTACCCPILSRKPTERPTQLPTISAQPSIEPTNKPTSIPTISQHPSQTPTLRPTGTPTITPSLRPTGTPTWKCPFVYNPAMSCTGVLVEGLCYVTEDFLFIPCNLLAARNCPQKENSVLGLACYASCLSYHSDCCCADTGPTPELPQKDPSASRKPRTQRRNPPAAAPSFPVPVPTI